MARKTKTLKLSAPIAVHEDVYSELLVKEPSARTFLELGPIDIVGGSSDNFYTTDVPGKLDEYVGRCVMAKDGETRMDIAALPVLLAGMSLKDGLALREVIMGFFTDARLALHGASSKTSSTTGSA